MGKREEDEEVDLAVIARGVALFCAALSGAGRSHSDTYVIDRAQIFEAYILEGKTPSPRTE